VCALLVLTLRDVLSFPLCQFNEVLQCYCLEQIGHGFVHFGPDGGHNTIAASSGEFVVFRAFRCGIESFQGCDDLAEFDLTWRHGEGVSTPWTPKASDQARTHKHTYELLKVLAGNISRLSNNL